jgi:hypothetical protein
MDKAHGNCGYRTTATALLAETLMKPKNATVITGILTPRQWDRRGNVTAVSIATADEKEYVIADESVTPAVLKNLRQLVRIRGELITGPEGRERLLLSSLGAVRKGGTWTGGVENEEERLLATEGDWYPARRADAKTIGRRNRAGNNRQSGLKRSQ